MFIVLKLHAKYTLFKNQLPNHRHKSIRIIRFYGVFHLLLHFKVVISDRSGERMSRAVCSISPTFVCHDDFSQPFMHVNRPPRKVLTRYMYLNSTWLWPDIRLLLVFNTHSLWLLLRVSKKVFLMESLELLLCFCPHFTVTLFCAVTSRQPT